MTAADFKMHVIDSNRREVSTETNQRSTNNMRVHVAGRERINGHARNSGEAIGAGADVKHGEAALSVRGHRVNVDDDGLTGSGSHDYNRLVRRNIDRGSPVACAGRNLNGISG